MKPVAEAAAGREVVKHMEINPFERGSARPVAIIVGMRVCGRSDVTVGEGDLERYGGVVETGSEANVTVTSGQAVIRQR